MKFFKLLVAACVLTFSFYSCKKDDVSKCTSTLVKTLTKNYYDTGTGVLAGSMTYNVTYDANNRVTSIISTDNTDKLLYDYPSSTKYTIDEYSNPSSIPDFHKEVYLNSVSLVDSVFFRQYGNDTVTEKYSYNSSKQLISKKTTPKGYSSTIDYYIYDASGNPTTNSTTNYVTTSTYSTLPNSNPLAEPNFFQSPNLILTSSTYNGGVLYSTSYTYTFDSNNRLSSEKTIDQQGRTTSMRTYSY